jgi:hypothetical protein
MAAVIAELRRELQETIDAAMAPLRDRVAMLEGQVSTLMTLLGADANRSSFEGSETIRKIRVSR